MRSIAVSLFILSIYCSLVCTSFAQMYIGAYGGLAQGIDESAQGGNQQNQLMFGGSVVYNLKNITRVSSEISVYYTNLGTKTLNTDNDYSTSIITTDVRARVFFNRDFRFSPYLGAGLGFSYFVNNSMPPNIANPIQPAAGAFLTFPMFVGASTPLNHRVDVDFQFGAVLTNTDQTNPILNGTYDHWMYARIGLYIRMLRRSEQ
jgi:opacity protein-like surface antigen